MNRHNTEYLIFLRESINVHFNIDEIQTLCFDLGIDYQNLPGETKIAKVRALIEYFLRNNRLPELIQKLKTSRPNIQWENNYQAKEQHKTANERLEIKIQEQTIISMHDDEDQEVWRILGISIAMSSNTRKIIMSITIIAMILYAALNVYNILNKPNMPIEQINTTATSTPEIKDDEKVEYSSSPTAAPSYPFGCVQGPHDQNIIKDTIDVVGWASVQASRVIRVEIWIDGKHMGNATYGTKWGDNNNGFYWEWNTRAIENGPHTLQVKAVADNGLSHYFNCGDQPRTLTVIVKN